MKIEVYRKGSSVPDKTLEIDEYDQESVKTGLEFIEKNKNKNIQIVMEQYSDNDSKGHDEFIIHDHLDFFEEMAKSENAENIKFRYSNGSSEFGLDKIIEDEKFLQTITNEIKEKQFTPLERMVAVYDIAQSIKPYVKGGEADDSRTLHEYLNNNYMVCVGYANFIANIGHMLGEHYSEIHGYVGENHRRNYVNLVDDKYEVNGFYGLDATFAETYGRDASQKEYRYFLMGTTEGREGATIASEDEIGSLYDEFFTYKNVEEFKKKIMTTKDFEALPPELKYTNELLSDNSSRHWNFIRLKEQLRNLDPDFFKTFEQLDFNKDEDIQIVLDYLKGKINQPLDKQKIVDAKMVVEQSKYKNLSTVDIEDMRVDVSRQVKRTAYGKGFEQYIEQRWQDVKSQTAEEAQEENKFLNCKAIYNAKLRQALSEKVSIGNFIGTELRDIDYQYFPRIEQKEEQLTENGCTIDKEEAYLEYSDKELEEFGLKRNIKIKLPDPSEKLTMEEQIAFYEKARDELYETLGLQQEQTQSPENLTQKLGKEVGINIHNDTRGKQETNEEMIEEEKELQNHLQEEQK